MYAVIKTGGKQYRVQPGDTIVVEKLDGAAGDVLSLGSVLMLGGDKGVTLGAPLIEGATVAATLIETRKGEKVKIFKKIRRQGYRRTRGHRQFESVLRVTAIGDGDARTETWDGVVDMTTKAELDARARNLKLPQFAEKAVSELPVEETPVAAAVMEAAADAEAAAVEPPKAKKAPAKKIATEDAGEA